MYLPGDFPPDRQVGHDWFALGVNYPYIWTHGCDIGPNQIAAENPNTPTPTAFGPQRLAQLRDDFARLSRWGCQVVRIWAFEEGEGLLWRRRGDEWVVSGISTVFLSNIGQITAAAEDAGLRVYWTLLTEANFNPGENPNQADRRRAEAFRTMLRSTWARNQFFHNAVLPFADTVLAHCGGAFALDLMNEPDMSWPVAPCNIREALSRTNYAARLAFEGLLAALPLRRLEQTSSAFWRILEARMLNFLGDMALSLRSHFERIRQRLLLSIGFAYLNTIERNRNQLDSCLDFYDFHFYDMIDVTNMRPNLPRWTNNSKACIIGECGLGGQFVKDRLSLPLIGRGPLRFPPQTTLGQIFQSQAQLIDYCMRTALQNGYGGCLIWEYGRQFRRVFQLQRSRTEHGVCRESGETRKLEHCLDWSDRIPLLWRKHDGVVEPPDQCVHLTAGSPVDELCGRPAVKKIEAFAGDLERSRLRMGP